MYSEIVPIAPFLALAGMVVVDVESNSDGWYLCYSRWLYSVLWQGIRVRGEWLLGPS